MKSKLYALVCCLMLIISCNKEEDNPGSAEAEIVSFSVSSTEGFKADKVFLDTDKKKIHVFSTEEITSLDFPVNIAPVIEVSTGAAISPGSGEEVEFSEGNSYVQYSTISENGATNHDWITIIRDKQIPNSNFNYWHTRIGINSKEFKEPGRYKESTLWATANMGTSTYGVYGTTAVLENGRSYVKLTTGETSAVPVTSGTLFLGKFDIQGAISNPTDPEKATDFGVPFIYRPKSLKVRYKYTSGETLIDGTLKDPNDLFGGFDIVLLEGKDKYKILSFLEKRDGGAVNEIARVELRGSDTGDNIQEAILNYEYSSDEEPTHLALVFASSAEGDFYKGAIGSTLIIESVELLYE